MREDENAVAGHRAGGFGLLISGFVVAALAVFFVLAGAGIVLGAILFSLYMGD